MDGSQRKAEYGCGSERPHINNSSVWPSPGVCLGVVRSSAFSRSGSAYREQSHHVPPSIGRPQLETQTPCAASWFYGRAIPASKTGRATMLPRWYADDPAKQS